MNDFVPIARFERIPDAVDLLNSLGVGDEGHLSMALDKQKIAQGYPFWRVFLEATFLVMIPKGLAEAASITAIDITGDEVPGFRDCPACGSSYAYPDPSLWREFLTALRLAQPSSRVSYLCWLCHHRFQSDVVQLPTGSPYRRAS